MTDLRARFERLDEIPARNVWAEVERRAERMAGLPAIEAFKPRMSWRKPHGVDQPSIGRRRLTPVPVLLVLLLLLLALLVSLTIGAGWGWWNRDGLLLIPTVSRLDSIRPDGDCPGAIAIGDPLPRDGWTLGPRPGWFATPHPGRITGMWNEPLQEPQLNPPGARHVLIELDPVTRTMCRLLITAGTFQGGLLDGGSLPDIDWTTFGDALAYFHGDVEEPNSCCKPGQLTLWTPGAQVDLPVFLRTESGAIDWSNSGGMLAVTASEPTRSWADPGPSAVAIYTADGQGPRELQFDCEPCLIFGKPFSPDDSRIAVTYWRATSDESADELIGVADTATGVGTVLDVGLTKLEVLGWQDDNTILAVDDGRRVVAVPVDAPAQFRVVANFPMQFGIDVFIEAWSPDHSRALYKRFNTNPPGGSGDILSTDLFVLDVAAGTTRLVAHETGDIGHLVWAPDNRTIAYTIPNNRNDASWGIQMHVTDAVEGRPVAIALGISPVAWRPVWR